MDTMSTAWTSCHSTVPLSQNLTTASCRSATIAVCDSVYDVSASYTLSPRAPAASHSVSLSASARNCSRLSLPTSVSSHAAIDTSVSV